MKLYKEHDFMYLYVIRDVTGRLEVVKLSCMYRISKHLLREIKIRYWKSLYFMVLFFATKFYLFPKNQTNALDIFVPGIFLSP